MMDGRIECQEAYSCSSTPVSSVSSVEAFPFHQKTFDGLGRTATGQEIRVLEEILVPQQNWHALWLLPVALAGVAGNVLVCIAVCVDRKLRNVTNYFLVSLAVADLLVSLVVMPCCTVQEFMGYWPLGLEVCGIWQVSDVTLCTSSIMHLCTISIDRFIGIRNPMLTRNRSPWIVAVKIGFVWVLSLLIASPLYFVVYFRPHEVLDPDGQHCSIMNRLFLVYGSVVAFFVPLVIMLVTYTLSMRVLTKQVTLLTRDNFDNKYDFLRRSKKLASIPPSMGTRAFPASEISVIAGKQVVDGVGFEQMEERRTTDARSSSQMEPSFDGSSSSIKDRLFVILGKRKKQAVGSRRNRPQHCFLQDDDTCCLSSASRREFQKRSGKYLRINNSETSIAVSDAYHDRSSLHLSRMVSDSRRSGDPDGSGEVLNPENDSETETSSPSRRKFDRTETKSDDQSGGSLEIDETPTNNNHRLARFYHRLMTIRPLQIMKRSLSNGSAASTPSPGPIRWPTTAFDSPEPDQSPAGSEDPLSNTPNASYRFKSLIQKHSAAIRVAGILMAKRERQKKEALHCVRNERKAIRVLGAMFAIFVVCWAPFFSVNLAVGICSDCQTSTLLFRTCLWLGYVSSTLNPIVYTVFNRSFRKTFLDIILPQRQCCRGRE